MRKILIIVLFLAATLFGINRRYIQQQFNTNNLAVYYKLWAGLTAPALVFDYSGNGNDGTLVGTLLLSVYPGLDIAGSDEYIDTGTTFQTTLASSYTMNIWVKLDDGQGAIDYIAATDADGSANNMFRLILSDDGKIIFAFSPQAAANRVDLKSGVVVFTNGAQPWKMLTIVADATVNGAGGLKLYVNGVFDSPPAAPFDGDTSAATEAEWSNYASAQNLYIGAWNLNGTAQNFYAGIMDDVMLFNVAKSAVEVKNLFETTRWRFGI